MAPVWLWLSLVATPVLAQVDRLGGPVEFRAADQPIRVPTTGFSESVSSDLNKLLGTTPSPADNVLKRIDKEMGQRGANTMATADTSRPSSSRASEKRELGESTFK